MNLAVIEPRLVRSDEIPVRGLVVFRQCFESQIGRAVPRDLARVTAAEFVEATGLHHGDRYVRRRCQPRSDCKARGTASDNLKGEPGQLSVTGVWDFFRQLTT